MTKNKHPNSIEDENGTELAKVAVSVDGTWQKRGHSSKIGVVFVISVATGEILEFAMSVELMAIHVWTKILRNTKLGKPAIQIATLTILPTLRTWRLLQQ